MNNNKIKNIVHTMYGLQICTRRKIFDLKILTIIFCLFVFTSCWYETYRTFELPNKDNYGKEKLLSNRLIDLEIRVSAHDESNGGAIPNISVSIHGLLKEQSELILDSISVNIIFPQDEVVKNYELTNISVFKMEAPFRELNFKTFNDIPTEVKLLNKVNKSILYGLSYWDFSRTPIPKTIKDITLEIFVKYNLNNITYEKNFTVHLKSQKERYLQHILMH